jgi:hypothetical protein
MGVGKEKE